MERDFLVGLTTKLYRITLLFPKKEPLRYKAREAGIEVLASWIIWEDFCCANPEKNSRVLEDKMRQAIFDIKRDLDVLNSYLEIAKWQNWASFFDILEIQKEYDKIRSETEGKVNEIAMRQEIKEMAENTAQKKLDLDSMEEKADSDYKTTKPLENGLDDRKRKIIEFLEQNNRAQVWELNKVLPNVTKRTLRRDFQYLFKKGLIERIGEKNSTYYQAKQKDVSMENALAGDYPISV